MPHHSLYLAIGLPAGFQVITDSRAAPHRVIYHAEHAVLIAAGMEIAQFASFPQSIIHHWNSRQICLICDFVKRRLI
jgi:hypothetical protein